MEAEEVAHKRAMEAERIREEVAHKRAMEAQKHELAVAELKSRNPSAAGSASPKIPKWERLCPQYDESKDIAEYFITFERLCSLHAIPEDQKMTTLIAKLTGRALDIFNKMPIGDASNYGKFKELVLKQFQVTPETYRVKFRSLKRGDGLSNVAYANEMTVLVDKWVRGKGITSFEGMCDLVAQEQFLNMCSDDVKQYLWDKQVKAVGELAGFADSYEQAQAAIKHKPLAEGYRVEGKQSHRVTPGKKEAGRSPPHSPSTRPKLPVQSEEPRRCYQCKSTEHLRDKCPLLSENRHQAAHEAAASFHTGFVKLTSTPPSSEHVHAVRLNGKVITGLRDTGAEISIVRRDLIQEKDWLPGKVAELELVGGYKVIAPLAKVHMQTENLQAKLTVATVSHNFAPFLLGNDFFAVAESIPGLGGSKQEPGAENPRGGGEVTGTAAVAAGVAVASSCPVIISPGEGNVLPHSKGGILRATEGSILACSCEPTAGPGSPSLQGDTGVSGPEGGPGREGEGGPESPPTFCQEDLAQEEGEKSAFQMPDPSPGDQVRRESWGSDLQEGGVRPADLLGTDTGVSKKEVVLATRVGGKPLSSKQKGASLCMGEVTQGDGNQPREIPEGGAEGRPGCNTPFPCQNLKPMPDSGACSKEAEESASECLPGYTDGWVILCLSLLHLWVITKELTLRVNPFKMGNIPDWWEKLLYMLGMVTSRSYKHVTCRPISGNRLEAWHNSKSITGPGCCVKGETEARRLMALRAKCRGSYALTGIAICILLAILHPNPFSGTRGPGTSHFAKTITNDTMWCAGTEKGCDQRQTGALCVLPPPWTVSKSLAVSSGGGCDGVPHKTLWGDAYKCIYVTRLCFMLHVPCNISL
ncbi:uncharacterized protein RBU57_002333 isoform 2-T3 [Macrochelys suwanniensis]